MLDLSNFLTHWVYPFLAVFLAGMAAYVLFRSQNWLDAHASFLDAQTRGELMAIETDALDSAVSHLMAVAKIEGGKIHLDVNNPLIRYGAQLVLNHAGGALGDHGMSPDEAAAKLLALLPPNVTTRDATGAIIAVPKTILSMPLPPIETTINPQGAKV